MMSVPTTLSQYHLLSTAFVFVVYTYVIHALLPGDFLHKYKAMWQILSMCFPKKIKRKRCLLWAVVLLLVTTVARYSQVRTGIDAVVRYGTQRLVENKDVRTSYRNSNYQGTLPEANALKNEHFSYKRTKHRFLRRKQCLQRACRQYRPVEKEIFPGKYHIINQSVLYCEIEKVGSARWVSIIHDIERTGSVVGDMFELEPEHEVSALYPYKASEIKFFFVREPYGRHLSAYADKLFSTNMIFWQSLGKYIIQKFRPSADLLSLNCGHDVTFAEYVKYVIDAEKTGENRNGHFLPQHQHCCICEFPYNYIGHLETIEEDTKFLMNAMQVPHLHIQDHMLMSIVKSTRYYFKHYEQFQQCITTEEGLRRLWKVFQIRGLVHKDIVFPFSSMQCKNISEEEFVQAGYQAVLQTRGLGGAQDNRMEALVDAFKSVPYQDKLDLQKYFWWDFRMFGYDPSPGYIFGNKSSKQKEF